MKPEPSFIDRILRQGPTIAEDLKNPEKAATFSRQALPWLFILGGIYGLVMGSSSIFWQFRWLFSLSSMVKVPLLLLGSSALCFPALYVFGIASGATLRPSSLWACQVAGLMVIALLTVAMAPIALFFLTTTKTYVVVKLLHVGIWTVAGIGGLRFFMRTLVTVDPKLAKNLRLMIFWMVIFGLVGAQMGWMMRPFIGAPNEEFHIFRHLRGSFFEDMLKHLRRMG